MILFGGYSAGWFYLADQLVTRTKATISAANRDGVTVECDNPIARGFPFRLGVYCDRVAYANAAEAVGLTAGNLRTAGQIYDPMRFIAELDGPATIATPRNGSLQSRLGEAARQRPLGKAAAGARIGRRRQCRGNHRDGRTARHHRRVRGAYAAERAGSRPRKQLSRAWRSTRRCSTAANCRSCRASPT